jgi:hypothetical protein
MSECSRGTCDIGVNPSRAGNYVLRCSDDRCAAVFPLTKELSNREICPKCNRAILIWYPKDWVKEKTQVREVTKKLW